jgi:hypothetical protein
MSDLKAAVVAVGIAACVLLALGALLVLGFGIAGLGGLMLTWPVLGAASWIAAMIALPDTRTSR